MKHFLSNTLGSIALQDQKDPMFADFAHIPCGKFRYLGMDIQQINKFLKDVQTLFRDDPSYILHMIATMDYWGDTRVPIHSKKSSIQESIGHHIQGCPWTLSPVGDICQTSKANSQRDERPQKLHPVCELFDHLGH
ncbi:hypothetical protein Tco_1285037 [Tanacetum coccineum]